MCLAHTRDQTCVPQLAEHGCNPSTFSGLVLRLGGGWKRSLLRIALYKRTVPPVEACPAAQGRPAGPCGVGPCPGLLLGGPPWLRQRPEHGPNSPSRVRAYGICGGYTPLNSFSRCRPACARSACACGNPPSSKGASSWCALRLLRRPLLRLALQPPAGGATDACTRSSPPGSGRWCNTRSPKTALCLQRPTGAGRRGRALVGRLGCSGGALPLAWHDVPGDSLVELPPCLLALKAAEDRALVRRLQVQQRRAYPQQEV